MSCFIANEDMVDISYSSFTERLQVTKKLRLNLRVFIKTECRSA